MGSSLAIAPRPQIVKLSSPAILSPPARAIAATYPSVAVKIVAPVAAATATFPPQAFSQRTLYPGAASATASIPRMSFSQRTMYPPAYAATAAVSAPVPLLRVATPAGIATASRGPVRRLEHSAAAALASGIGLRSAFAGPDENPLSEGGRWTALLTAMQRTNGQAKGTGVAGVNHSERFTDMPDLADMDVVAQLAVPPAANTGDVAIMGRLSASGAGYGAVLPGPSANTIRIYRFSGGSTIGSVIAQSASLIPMQAGLWMRLSLRGTRLTAWYRLPGDADWTFACEGVEGVVTAAGKAGMRIFGAFGAFSAFGAWAPLPPIPTISVAIPARNATAARVAPTISTPTNRFVHPPPAAATASRGTVVVI